MKRRVNLEIQLKYLDKLVGIVDPIGGRDCCRSSRRIQTRSIGGPCVLLVWSAF